MIPFDYLNDCLRKGLDARLLKDLNNNDLEDEIKIWLGKFPSDIFGKTSGYNTLLQLDVFYERNKKLLERVHNLDHYPSTVRMNLFEEALVDALKQARSEAIKLNETNNNQIYMLFQPFVLDYSISSTNFPKPSSMFDANFDRGLLEKPIYFKTNILMQIMAFTRPKP